MAENVKRVNVTLPLAQVERITQLMADDPAAYPTVSAFVSRAIADRLADEEAHRMLLAVLREQAGEPDEEDRAWAQEALRLADQVAAEPWRGAEGAA
ncbi:MAG: hypothetical protein ACRD0K_05005 [Egibacteraceae bacterium]